MTQHSDSNNQNNRQDLLKGAAANLFGFVVRLGARLPFLFVVALLYGKDIFGQYLFAVTIIETLTAVFLFGFKRSLFHFIHDDLHHGNLAGIYNTVITAIVICITLGICITVPFYLSEDILIQIFPETMVEGVLLLLPVALIYALAEILLTATRAARKMRYEVTAKSIVEPYVLLISSSVFYFIGQLHYGLFISYWIMNICVLIYTIYAFQKVYQRTPKKWQSISWVKAKSMIGFSAPTAAYDLIGVLILRIDVYFLAAIVSPGALGIYGIALQIVTIVKKIRQSFDPILEPVISQIAKQNNITAVSDELSRVSYWVFSIQAFIFTLLFFYGEPLLGLFNAGGEQAHTTLLLLVGAIIVNGSLGLSELVFLYKKPTVNPVLSLVILCLHATLCYILSVEYGIIGAAASLLISYLVTEFIRLILVKVYFDIFPLSLLMMKPLILSTALFGYLFLMSQMITLHTITGVIVGIFGGVFVYFLCFFIIAQKEEKYILMQKLAVKKP